jgi:hypothetical protein
VGRPVSEQLFDPVNVYFEAPLAMRLCKSSPSAKVKAIFSMG